MKNISYNNEGNLVIENKGTYEVIFLGVDEFISKFCDIIVKNYTSSPDDNISEFKKRTENYGYKMLSTEVLDFLTGSAYYMGNIESAMKTIKGAKRIVLMHEPYYGQRTYINGDFFSEGYLKTAIINPVHWTGVYGGVRLVHYITQIARKGDYFLFLREISG